MIVYLLDAASALGIGFLSIPVWKANADRKRLTQLRDGDFGMTSQFEQDVLSTTIKKALKELSTWKWWHSWCLWVGYVLLLGSALLRLLPALRA